MYDREGHSPSRRCRCTEEHEIPLADVGGAVFETADTSATISALLLKRLGLTTSRVPADETQWNHLSGIELADPTFTTPGDINLLLGEEVYSKIIRNGLRHGHERTPTVQNSSLG